MSIIGRFAHENGPRYAHVEDDRAFFLSDPWSGEDNARFDPASATRTGENAALESLRLLPPVVPRKLISIGLNYHDHAKETGKEQPTHPLMWFKAPTSIIAHGQPIEIAYPLNRTDYEAELALVVGRTVRGVSEDSALGMLAGVCAAQDITDRTIQNSESQWARAKSLDTYTPLGPFLHTDLDAQNLEVRTLVNGEVRQQGSTANMIFPIRELLAFISEAITLQAGDVILTGTPFGIGPIVEGDVVETRIGPMLLSNPVRNRAATST
jgi:2-keto-4-pentenoate hydratase/2-oxohepta-3-ene-1,7-dioic acid hydratase in catechol pathway